ncbi:hypothetical protein L1049_002222 [Liquidambar formosana]|uniref:Uncharacterized protein n=1 Tax=Liquidambar formosana TaxID=63359 RepID=A0AAP0R6H8_LIQFO
MASTSYRDDNNTIGSQVDSSSVLVTSLDPQKTKTRESSTENNLSKYTSEQSSSRIRLCTKCKCPGHDSRTCLWLKESSANISVDNQNQNQNFSCTASPCGTGDNIPPN